MDLVRTYLENLVIGSFILLNKKRHELQVQQVTRNFYKLWTNK